MTKRRTTTKATPAAPFTSDTGRDAGRKGGPARARALTPERRREIARAASAARWARRR